ncbi:MAG: AI-2E family transporter [Oscillospiraceae bacterium]
MRKFRIDPKYICWGITAIIVIVSSTCFFWILQKLPAIAKFLLSFLKILSPFIWGFVLTCLLSPIMYRFEEKIFVPLVEHFLPDYRKKESLCRALSIALALVLSFAIVTTLLMMVLPQVYESIESIVRSLPDYANQIIRWTNNLLKENPELKKVLTSMLGDASNNLTDWLQTNVLSGMNNVVTSVSTSVYKIVMELLNILIGVVISCYLLFNKEHFGGSMRKLLYSIFNEKRVASIYKVAEDVNTAFMGFISGKLLDSLIIGFLCGICCTIMRMPYVVLISVVVGVTNIIPFFGPFIGAVPCALLIFMVSPFKCLIFVLFIIVLQQIDGNIIGPKILGSTTGLSGFWVMFAILVGQGFFGVIGLILGVPVMSLIYAMVKTLIEKNLVKRGLPVDSESYEAQYNEKRSAFWKSKKTEADSEETAETTSDASENDAEGTPPKQ